MYNNGGVAGTSTGVGGGLAMTGFTGDLLWMFLTAFALMALGMALWRTAPRSER